MNDPAALQQHITVVSTPLSRLDTMPTCFFPCVVKIFGGLDVEVLTPVSSIL